MYTIIQTFQMLLSKDTTIIKKSALFDAQYYLHTYPDIKKAGVDPLKHFIRHGWKEGRNPSSQFNTKIYLSNYQDVAENGMNPLVHYIRYGQKEGRTAGIIFQSIAFSAHLVTFQEKILHDILYSFQKNKKITSHQINTITIITPKHTLYVAHLLYKELTDCGYNITIETTLPEEFGENLHIIICPQIFNRMPDHYIAFQMEQLKTSQWFDEHYFSILKKSIAIFDYSVTNLEYLYNNTILYEQLFFLPIAPFENYQQFLIQKGYWDGCKSDRYEVLFYGDPNSQRRSGYLEALKKKFSIKIINEVFGNELYTALLSTKVVVNIHYYENALLETTRIYESLSLGLNVVSEESIDMQAHQPLLDQVDFTRVGDIEHMIEKIEKILKRKKVSIVIPCYNQQEFLDESVRSVLNQSYKEIEIIIVNDGSTDNSMEIACKWARRYPDKVRVIEQENMGLSEARNFGVKTASSDYLFLLDADDKLHPTMIGKCMSNLDKHDVDIVYADYQHFGERDTIQCTGDKVELYYLQYANITGATALYKKEVWKKTGGYKMNMHGGYEDWEFWVNAAKHDFKFYHIPEVLYYYRVKKESMYTDALKKHTYLCSKIVMNHPDLYTDKQQDDAIKIIKAFENLPELYFYFNNDIFEDEKEIVLLIGNYINDNKLNTSIKSGATHIIPSIDKYGSIALCSLELIKNNEQLEHKPVELDVDHIVYYAKLKYNITQANELKSSLFAWSNSKGVTQGVGTSFLFTYHNSMMLKIAAYKRSEKYLQEKDNGFEHRLGLKDRHIENLDLMIRNQKEEIEQLKEKLNLL